MEKETKRTRDEDESPSEKTKKHKSDQPSDETEYLKRMIEQLQREKEQITSKAEQAEQEKEQIKLKAEQEKEEMIIKAQQAEQEKEQIKLKAEQEKEEIRLKADHEVLKRIRAEKRLQQLLANQRRRISQIESVDGKVFANIPPSSATRENIKPICLESRVGNHPAFLWIAQMVYQEQFRDRILIESFGEDHVKSFRDSAKEMQIKWKRVWTQRKEKACIGPFAVDRSETITTAILTHPFSTFVHQWHPASNGGRFEAYHELPLLPANTIWDKNERPASSVSLNQLLVPEQENSSSSKKRADCGRGELDLVICYFPNKDKLDCSVPLFIEAGLGLDKDPQAFLYSTFLDRLCTRKDMEQYSLPHAFLGITINVDHNSLDVGRFRLNAYCRARTFDEKQPKLAECFIFEGNIDQLSLVLEVAWAFAKYQTVMTGKASPWKTVDIRNDTVQGKKYVFKSYGKPNSATNRSWQLTKQFLNGECIDISPHLKVIKYPYIEGSHWASSPRQFLPIIEQLQSLHNQNIVHGDIRRYNIVFSPSGSSLIDFDFAGEPNLRKYPVGYAKVYDCERHPNALPECSLQFEHDIYSLISVMKQHTFSDSVVQEKWSEVCKCNSLNDLKSVMLSHIDILDQPFISNETTDAVQTATDHSPQP